MQAAVEVERWNEAQSSESGFWAGINVPVLLRICADMLSFLDQIGPGQLAQILDGKEVLEIGCGPCAISPVSFYRGKSRIHRFVKTDPLQRVSIMSLPVWSSEHDHDFLKWVSSLSDEGEYLQTKGESLQFSGAFDTAITHNVLDHVMAPLEVLNSAFKALRPGGNVLVGVDCRSMAGKLKFELYTRRAKRNTTLVQAHPFTFVAQDVVSLLQDAGFKDIKSFTVRKAIDAIVGHATRLAFIGTKP